MSLEKIRWDREGVDGQGNKVIKPGQVAKLQAWAHAGAKAYFIFEVKNEQEHFAVIHNPETVYNWRRIGRTSVPVETLKEKAVFSMYRAKHLRHGTYWPLDRFIHVVNRDFAE